MNWFDTIALWAGRVLLMLGAFYSFSVVATYMCNCIYRRMRVGSLFLAFLMQRKKTLHRAE